MKNSKISIQILKDSEAGEELKGKEFKEVLNNKEDIKVEGKTGVTMGNQEARVNVEK